jgi:hypothetical protein
MLRPILIISLLMSMMSCSFFRRSGVKIMGPALKDSAVELQKQTNFKMFQEATPSNLMMLEAILSIDPNNRDLLSALIQGYSAYAFAVHETYYLHDQYSNSNNYAHRDQALIYYTTALNYSRRYLQTYDIDWDVFKKSVMNPTQAGKYLKSNFDRDDLVALLFTAQALGSSINLQRDQILLVSELTVVKSLFDWGCAIEPNFQNGICPIFEASYLAGRPKMLGGDPEQGKQIFLKAMQQDPKNLMIAVSYLQLSVIPASDEDEFKRVEQLIAPVKKEFDAALSYSEQLKGNVNTVRAELNLFQAIALKRFEIMKNNQKILF